MNACSSAYQFQQIDASYLNEQLITADNIAQSRIRLHLRLRRK